MSKRVREKCGKLCISSILSCKRGITPTKIDANWRPSNLICSTVRQSKNAKFQPDMSKHVREKCGKLCISSILSSKKGHNSYKIWWKLTTLKLDLSYSKTKWNAKFQLNMSKRVWEKCGKLCIFSILHSKRGITPTKINANWQHSYLICSTVKRNHMQNFSSICQSM